MNNFLASAVSVLNGIVAVIIVIVGVRVGGMLADTTEIPLYWGIGTVGGFVVAIAVCGSLAILIDIRVMIKRHLEEPEDPRFLRPYKRGESGND